MKQVHAWTWSASFRAPYPWSGAPASQPAGPRPRGPVLACVLLAALTVSSVILLDAHGIVPPGPCGEDPVSPSPACDVPW
jgi:hypothetical protein